MQRAILFLAVFCWSALVRAADRHVHPGQSIQAAIAQSVAGDRVLVHPGTYHESIDFLGKAIEVRSTDGPEVTTINSSATGTWGVLAISGETIATKLVGFRFVGHPNGFSNGNAIRIAGAALVVEDCWFQGLKGVNGPAINASNATEVVVRRCKVVACESQGGAVWLLAAKAMLEDCDFSGNISRGVADVYILRSDYSSGEVGVFNSRFMTGRGPVVDGYVSKCRGSIFVQGARVTFENSVIADVDCAYDSNTGVLGIVNYSPLGSGGFSRIMRSTIVRNTGFPLYYHNNNCQFNPIAIDINSSVICQNEGHIFLVGCQQSSDRLWYSAISPGFQFWGNSNNNISTSNPLLNNPLGGDFWPTAASPCRDAGDPSLPLDADGTRADIGAHVLLGLNDCNADGINDAVQVTTDCNNNQVLDACEPDCNGNLRPDDCDVALGASLDLNQDGIPDECKPDCNINGVPDFVEIFYGLQPDCNTNGVPDGCELAAGTALDCNGNQRPDACDIALDASLDCDLNVAIDACELATRDCNGNGVVDRCDINAGTSLDLNQDGHPDECKPDCNQNGLPDYLDLAFQVSVDCNANAVPDECDLAGMPGADCNANSRIDSCEVASGQAPDCNGNLRPDSCDLADGAQDAYGISGASIFCNPNGVPDVCEPAIDLNTNGLPDYCDILSGAPDRYGLVAGGGVVCAPDGMLDSSQPVADCDANGWPDYCEISVDGAADCDGSLVPDDCQLASGTARDCNANGVIDGCDIAAGAVDAYGAAGASVTCGPDGIPDACQPVSDCDSDGEPDACAISAGAADVYGVGVGGGISCAPNGVPDACEPLADCDADGFPDACELAAGAADCDGDLAPDACEIADLPSLDCDGNQQLDACELQQGAGDCDGDGLLNLCEIQAGAADCDANGVPDACQLQSNPAVDCNLDGQIDSCELAAGAPDCNGNARLDTCDIAVGLSVDANQNNVPDECECATSNFCIPLPNSTGQPALIALVGTPSLSLNNASLRCTQLPPSASGLFFFGNSGLNPGNPFGNGRLCVTGGVRRLPLAQAVAGVVTQPQDFTGSAYAGIQAGDVRFFQFWYRNTAAGGAGFNLSDGIRVTFCP